MTSRWHSGVDRRTILGFGAAGVASLAMPDISFAATGTIKLRVYSGYFKTVFDREIIPRFRTASGITVRTVADTTSANWLTQLDKSARIGVAPSDVSMMSRVTTGQGVTTKLWAPLNLAALPNSAKVKPEFIKKYPDGRTAAIGAAAWSILDDTAYWVVSKASRMTSQSHMFIDYMCRADVQALLKAKLGTTPPLKA